MLVVLTLRLREARMVHANAGAHRAGQRHLAQVDALRSGGTSLVQRVDERDEVFTQGDILE